MGQSLLYLRTKPKSIFESVSVSTRRRDTSLSPYLWALFDEVSHQGLTFLVVQNYDLYATTSQEVFLPLEMNVLPDHDTWNSVQQYRARAHAAWAGTRRPIRS